MTSFKPSKKLKEYLARIEAMRTKEGIKQGEVAGTFSMREIRGMKRLLNNYSKIAESERQQLFDALIMAINQDYWQEGEINWLDALSPFGIDEQQTRRGLEWFGKNIKKWEREAKRVRLSSSFNTFVLCVRNAITLGQFKEFRFGGFQKNAPDNATSRHYGLFNVIPIWQVVMKDGTSFAYSYGSWQSNSSITLNPDFELQG